VIFRKPQIIEFPVLLLSLGCLTYIYAVIDVIPNRIDSFQLLTVRVCLILTGICLCGETFFGKDLFRIGSLVAHLVVLFATLGFLQGAYIIEELMLISLFVLQSSIRLSVVRGLVLNLIALLCVTLIGINFDNGANNRIAILLFGVFWAFITAIIMYYRERLVEKSKVVDEQHRSLENLAAAAHSFVEHLEDVEIESAERERQRITRELHDEIGYAMTNISMMMNATRGLLDTDPETLLDYCRKAREIAANTHRETRKTLYKLRGMEKKVTTNPGIFFIKLCQDFAVATGIETECHVGNLAGQMNAVVFNALFRAVQVGFVNALRHGDAAYIRLSFWTDDEELRMRIWNDTQISAADSAVITEGIGLKGTYERLETVSGRLGFGPVADGFEFVVFIPKEELSRAAN
jgi:signal transduction histidine kinase